MYRPILKCCIKTKSTVPSQIHKTESLSSCHYAAGTFCWAISYQPYYRKKEITITFINLIHSRPQIIAPTLQRILDFSLLFAWLLDPFWGQGGDAGASPSCICAKAGSTPEQFSSSSQGISGLGSLLKGISPVPWRCPDSQNTSQVYYATGFELRTLHFSAISDMSPTMQNVHRYTSVFPGMSVQH